MGAQGARASPENPRIQTIIRADSRKTDIDFLSLVERIAYLYISSVAYRATRKIRYFPSSLLYNLDWKG
jgi:hypothetical protein